MPYAVSNKLDNTPPQDGQPIGFRLCDPEIDGLEDYEVLIESADLAGIEEPVWDASSGKPRAMTEAEKNAPKPLYGMEGLYAEVQARKRAGKPDPITTDELLTMMERVQAGEVKG